MSKKPIILKSLCDKCLKQRGEEEPTPVIFRRWTGREGNDVIALFPSVAADRLGHMCQSYMHLGQHGAADPVGILSKTKHASTDDADVQELITELQGRGYVHMVVLKRQSRQHYEQRRKQLVEIL